MFEINRTLPRLLDSTILLLHRLNPHSHEYRTIYDEMDSTRAGFNGESRVDRILLELSPIDNFFVIPNLRLQVRPNQKIELDTLIVTDRYLLILEIKALRGLIRFKTNPYSLEIETEGRIYERECPQIQLLRAIDGLQTWLKERGYTIPVHGFLTFAYRNIRVELPPQLVHLTYANELPFQIRMLTSKMKPKLSKVQLHQLTSALREAHQPFIPYPLCDYYRVEPEKLLKGHFCRQCGNRLLRKSAKSWWCIKCERNVQDAPLRALEEWFMFVKDSISNEECREWLGLKDKYAAGYILRNTTLEPIGENRARRYVLGEKDRVNMSINRRDSC